MQKTHRVTFILITLLLLNGCFFSNPSHRLPIKGYLSLQSMQDGDICFSPKLKELKISETKIEQISYFKFKGAQIYQGEKLRNRTYYYFFNPKIDYIKLDGNSKICLVKPSSEIERVIKQKLVPGVYTIEMFGEHPHSNTRIRLYGEFNYY